MIFLLKVNLKSFLCGVLLCERFLPTYSFLLAPKLSKGKKSTHRSSAACNVLRKKGGVLAYHTNTLTHWCV